MQHRDPSRFSIKRLRAVCQAEKLRRPRDLTWWNRTVSIYATWLLIRTPATADHVTLASIATGLLAAVAFALDGLAWGLVGVLLLYVSFLFDQVDGEVARFHRRTSLRGVYLDELRHLLIYAVPVFGLSIHTARFTNEVWPVVPGFVAALALALSRVEERLPEAIFGARAAALVGKARTEDPARSRDAATPGEPPAPPSGGSPGGARALLRSAARVAVVSYEILAHQVTIIFWIALAIVLDRAVLSAPAAEAAFEIALATTTSLALVASIASRARGDDVERHAARLATRAFEAARA